MDENAHRFIGSPARVRYLAWSAQTRGDIAAAVAHYEQARATWPRDWSAYYELGKLKLEEGDFPGAARVFQEYPPFKDPRDDGRVGLSNYAFDAGSLLYWRGAIDEAIPLYRIAAGFDTGSDASLTSALRLKALQGRFAEAAGESLARARRYHSVYAYRDYLAWLHAMGFGQEAWLAFDELMTAFDNPQIWASAYVGHRVAGISNQELHTWLTHERMRVPAVQGRRLAANYALLHYVVDRMPDEDFVKLMEQIEAPSGAVVEKQGYTVRGDAQSGWQTAGPSPFRRDRRAARTEGAPVKSELVYFAQAYTAMRRGDHAAAFASFDEMSQHYHFEESWIMPYFAWAAARSGNGAEFEAYIDQAPSERAFDFQLTKAFLAGARDDHDAAMRHLRLALARRVQTEARPVLVEYQYAQACQWLYEASKHDGYRVLALDWARKHQRIQPMYAWAYAMEAKLTHSAADRMRALGIAL